MHPVADLLYCALQDSDSIVAYKVACSRGGGGTGAADDGR